MRSDIEIRIKYSTGAKLILILVLILCGFSAFSLGILLAGRSAGDWLTAYMTFYLAIATIALAIATVIVITLQGRQLKRQLELQVITDLYKEWNKDEMRKYRGELCETLILTGGGEIDVAKLDLDDVEGVIEFLERIASYYANKVLSRKLVWDTFSWYITRYYYYTKQAIPLIEIKWGSEKHPDTTLYKDLRELLLSAINRLTYWETYAINIACKKSMLAPYRPLPKNIFAN